MTDTFYEGRDLEVLGDMPNYYSWIMETFKPHVAGRVVEYGAGAGTVSAQLLPLASRLTLVEPSANLTVLLKDRFKGESQVEIIDAFLQDHVASLQDNSVDTIILVNVLEHIEDDRDAARHLVRALRPGGKLLIFVPALQALMSELDRVHGHFRRYHRDDLVTKIQAAGADVLACRYFDFVGVFPWFVLNRLMGATAFNPALISINDRFVVPVSRLMEQMVGAPFGKNLILVATKKAAG
jgi:SAM-dependent methyltransferase